MGREIKQYEDQDQVRVGYLEGVARPVSSDLLEITHFRSGREHIPIYGNRGEKELRGPRELKDVRALFFYPPKNERIMEEYYMLISSLYLVKSTRDVCEYWIGRWTEEIASIPARDDMTEEERRDEVAWMEASILGWKAIENGNEGKLISISTKFNALLEILITHTNEFVLNEHKSYREERIQRAVESITRIEQD
jgi:hypothetical protein